MRKYTTSKSVHIMHVKVLGKTLTACWSGHVLSGLGGISAGDRYWYYDVQGCFHTWGSTGMTCDGEPAVMRLPAIHI